MRLLSALLATTFAIGAADAQGWVQLTPAGPFAARDGRPGAGKSWTLNDAQGAKLAAEFTAVARQTPVVIDYDHQTLYLKEHGQKAPAAGWMTEGEWRPGQGLFAKTKWTPAAAEHIKNGEYLYVSPVLMYDEKTFEIKSIAMAALVNYPAVLGMHPAVAHLATQFHQEQDMNPILAALLAGLGLAETATLEQATAALATLKTTAEKPPVPAALATALNLQAGADEAAALAVITTLRQAPGSAATAMAALQAEVAQLRAQINGDKAVSTVDDAIKAGKLIPAQRDWALGLARTDMAALSAYLATAPVIPMNGQSGDKEREGETTATEAALSGQLIKGFGLTPEQFAKGKPATA